MAVDPECIAAVTAAAALLADLGHDVREATPPWREPSLFDTFIAVWQVGPALHPVEDISLLTTLNRGLIEAAHAASAARLWTRGRVAADPGPPDRRVLE